MRAQEVLGQPQLYDDVFFLLHHFVGLHVDMTHDVKFLEFGRSD
jgi:hypothetical protein